MEVSFLEKIEPLEIQEGHRYIVFATVKDGYESDAKTSAEVVQHIEGAFAQLGAQARVVGLVGLKTEIAEAPYGATTQHPGGDPL